MKIDWTKIIIGTSLVLFGWLLPIRSPLEPSRSHILSIDSTTTITAIPGIPSIVKGPVKSVAGDTVYIATLFPVIKVGETILIEKETKDSTVLISKDSSLTLPLHLSFKSKTYLTRNIDGNILEITDHKWAIEPDWYQFKSMTPDTIHKEVKVVQVQFKERPWIEEPLVVAGITIGVIGGIAYAIKELTK